MSDKRDALNERKNELFALLSDTVIRDGYDPPLGMNLKRELVFIMEENRRKAEQRKDALSSQARIEKISSALSGVEEKRNTIQKSLDEEYTRLGAIMFEQKKLGILDKRISYVDSDYATYLRLLEGSQNPLRRVLSKFDLASFEKDAPLRYRNYSASLYRDGNENLLTGDNALGVKAVIAKLRARLEAQDEAYAMMKRKLEEERKNKPEVEESNCSQEESLRISYGSYLFENGQRWIDSDTPDDILDVISSILEIEGEIDQEEGRIRKEEGMLKVKELDALISENLRRIDAIEAEIERLEAKISSIRHDIKTLEEQKGEIMASSN